MGTEFKPAAAFHLPWAVSQLDKRVSMRLLDRYILNNFLIPFLLCFFGFLAIWFVFDLKDNISTFIEAQVHPRFVVYFYLTQLPEIVVTALPLGMLLALLFAMSKMSRSNEIIAMLTAGESLVRLIVPLAVVGLLVTGFSLALNYKLAPRADVEKKRMLDGIRSGNQKPDTLEGQLFPNRMDGRTWYVQEMATANIADNSALTGLHITEQDAKGNITTKWYASKATFNPVTKIWRLVWGKTVHFDLEGNITSERSWKTLEINNWSETPWRIASSNLAAAGLTVPELETYLKYNADFPEAQLASYRTYLHYRWALPWQCLIAVLIAAPLGIVFSRRGVLSGVASAIFCYSGMTFFSFFMLALGKGSRVPPVVAAWSPPIVFGCLGLYFLYLRATNREAPKFSRLFGFQ